MSDPDDQPDPLDQAYRQAEALLSDDDARAARRARLLAAIAAEPARPIEPAPPLAVAPRRPAWRRGGWLAAAGVVGLGMFLATQVRLPGPRPSPPAPARTAAMAPPAAEPSPEASAVAPPETLARAPATPPAQAAARPAVPAAAPPPIIPPVPQAFPAAPAPPPPAPPPPPPMAEQKAQDFVAKDAGRLAGGAAESETAGQRQYRSTGLAAPSAAARDRMEAATDQPSDPAERLRAAAAAGRTRELETLLDQGAPVDATDEGGETALMKAVQAGHPAAAAALRRHGASLDRRDRAGRSARDRAAAMDDPDLDQALGLAR